MSDLANNRLTVHEKLLSIIGEFSDDGKVYFKPDSNVKLKYPCIVYSRKGSVSKFANNKKYLEYIEYQVTVIDRDSDSEIVNRILDEFEYSQRTVEFVKDGLYHLI